MTEITWPKGTKLIRNDGKIAYYIGKSQRDNHPTVEFESSTSGWGYIYGDFPEYKSIAGNTYWYINDELDRWTEYEKKGKKWDGVLPLPNKWYVVWYSSQDTTDTNKHFFDVWKGNFGYVKTGVIDNKGGWRGYINDGNSKGDFVPRDGELEISMEQFRRYVMKGEESAPVQETVKGNQWGFTKGERVTDGHLSGVYIRDREGGEGTIMLDICRNRKWGNGSDWFISSDKWKREEVIEKKAEEKKKIEEKFNVGDYVKAIERGYVGNCDRIMEKGEEGIIIEIDGNYIKVELKDGKTVRRLNSFLKRIPKPPESIMSQDSSPKWAIKRTPGNSKEVNSLINGKYGYNGLAHEDGYIHIPKISGYAGAMGRLQQGYKEISLEQLKAHLGLIIEAPKKEETSKPTYKYRVGQKVKYKDYRCEGVGDIVKIDKVGAGPYLVEIGNASGAAYYDKNGYGGTTCRWFTEECLSEYNWESSLINSWTRTWDSPCVEYLGQELPSYSPHSMSAADVAEAVTEYLYGREKHTRVEKHPKEIIMGRKTRKKRGLI